MQGCLNAAGNPVCTGLSTHADFKYQLVVENVAKGSTGFYLCYNRCDERGKLYKESKTCNRRTGNRAHKNAVKQ